MFPPFHQFACESAQHWLTNPQFMNASICLHRASKQRIGGEAAYGASP